MDCTAGRSLQSLHTASACQAMERKERADAARSAQLQPLRAVMHWSCGKWQSRPQFEPNALLSVSHGAMQGSRLLSDACNASDDQALSQGCSLPTKAGKHLEHAHSLRPLPWEQERNGGVRHWPPGSRHAACLSSWCWGSFKGSCWCWLNTWSPSIHLHNCRLGLLPAPVGLQALPLLPVLLALCHLCSMCILRGWGSGEPAACWYQSQQSCTVELGLEYSRSSCCVLDAAPVVGAPTSITVLLY